MAIPLVAMVGLLAYVAGTSINNAVNLDRAPRLIHATSLPTADFVKLLQDERAAAVVYLFQPSTDNLAAYNAATQKTDAGKPTFLAAMNSSGTKSAETADEARGIQTMEAGLAQLPQLRQGIMARALSPLQALGAYSQGIGNEPKLFLEEANSLTNANAAGQALGLIATVSAREALSEEYALLSGVLAGNRITQADRAAFGQMVATRQGDLVDADSLLDTANRNLFNSRINNTQQAQLAAIEGAVAAGTPVARLPITLGEWQGLAGQLLDQYFMGGVDVAGAQLVVDNNLSNSAKLRVALTGGIGLAGLLATIVVTTLVGRGIIRRLGGLERNALQLAEVQLPDVVGRLRRGEDVDVASEAPALRVGGDEIGRVGQAFDLVRQTAIRAAVEEAKLRQGINDVFRSLARRSQSLLHRQLTLLDQMERRATDPEALDDLFRLDHLTTRMRRHAEGLVILAGAPPGRGWSSPVRMVDVMRGAIAEVEDYARVSVATRSQAALSGSAVADVIHLLAELIENATTLSPPYTSVRVAGETVASGFAIEVEDRGLGMSPAKLAELNERLAHPPEFNPSDSEQLGLFVVGQLAKRHGIKVTLKASPYGGTSAIVLIPQNLVVTEETFRAGLPGEPAAITMTPAGTNGSDRSDQPGFPPLRGVPGLAEGPRISGPLRRAPGGGAPIPGAPIPTEGGPARGTPAALGPANGSAGLPPLPPAAGELPRRHHGPPADAASTGGFPAGPTGGIPEGTISGIPVGKGDFDVFTPRRRGEPPETGAPPPDSAPYPGPAAGAPSAGPSSAGPSSAGTGAPYQDQPAAFPGWADRNPAAAGPALTGPATPMTPVASGPPRASGPPWELSRDPGASPAVPSGSAGPPAGSGAAGPLGPGQGADEDYKGLPRRVKQASLAPQLRSEPPRLRTATGGVSGGPTPAEIRKTMSALQRGWQEGRSQPAEPGSAPTAPGSAEPGSAPLDSTTD